MSILTQSALAQSTAAAGLDLTAELIVSIPLGCSFAEYQGTRATLEAEGVIPAGTKWPDAFNDLVWEDGTFEYWLRRKRPEGIKGPRKNFLSVDWWMFRCDPIQRKSHETVAIEKKSKELADEIHRHSPKGKEEWNKQWFASLEAQRDDRFQDFIALIPGATKPKRSRRPTRSARPQGAQA